MIASCCFKVGHFSNWLKGLSKGAADPCKKTSRVKGLSQQNWSQLWGTKLWDCLQDATEHYRIPQSDLNDSIGCSQKEWGPESWRLISLQLNLGLLPYHGYILTDHKSDPKSDALQSLKTDNRICAVRGRDAKLILQVSQKNNARHEPPESCGFYTRRHERMILAPQKAVALVSSLLVQTITYTEAFQLLPALQTTYVNHKTTACWFALGKQAWGPSYMPFGMIVRRISILLRQKAFLSIDDREMVGLHTWWCLFNHTSGYAMMCHQIGANLMAYSPGQQLFSQWCQPISQLNRCLESSGQFHRPAPI